MRPRIIALVVTAIATVIIIGVLMGVHMYLPTPWPPEPRPATELVEIDPDFVELFTPGESAPTPAPPPAPAPVPAPMPVTTKTTATTPTPKATSTTATPKVTPAPTAAPVPTGASELAKNAFAASAATEADTPNAGTETGTPTAATEAGAPTGTVGGGWKMPGFAKVKSYSTGSIVLRAVVDREGRVSSVTLIGGKAPASGDTDLVARCIAEVRRHRFTRDDDNAPDTAIARIVYTFK